MSEGSMGNAKWSRSFGHAAVLVAVLCAAAPARAQDVPRTLRQQALLNFKGSVSSVLLPDAGSQYLADRTALQRLGKALFWDAQLGSDGQACASCHFHAGADNRSKNQINPGFRNETFAGGDSTFGNSPLPGVSTPSFGPNYQLKRADFPLHRLSNDTDPRSGVLSDTNDVVSSQGAFAATFKGVGFPKDDGKVDLQGALASMFRVGDALARSVAPRNTPTAVNAVYNRRNFWDSRGRDEFNGVNPIGDLDPTARVVKVPADVQGKPQAPQFVAVSVPGASAASQAVGPPLSDVEMSYSGRQYADLGRKMLSPQLTALGQQVVATDDDLLGHYSAQKFGPGVTGITLRYADLVQQAFPRAWWNAPGWKVDVSGVQPVLVQTSAPGPNLFTVMEYNFSFFLGLAVDEYEKTLRADDSPFDRFLRGDENALGLAERDGLWVFMTRGRCKECHSGQLLSNASIAAQDTAALQTDQLLPPHNIERMITGSPCSPEEQATSTCLVDLTAATDPRDPVVAMYDSGFYNIGVRPSLEDLGIGANIGPLSLPLSHSKRSVDCVREKVAPLLAQGFNEDAAVRTANNQCAVPHIASRPIEAATILSRAWTLATLDGLPPQDEVGADGKTVVKPGSVTIGNLIGVAKSLLTGQNVTGAGVTEACAKLVQARDGLQAQLPSVIDPVNQPVQARVARLLPLATSLLPDPVNPGPNLLEPFGPPLRPDEDSNVRGAFKVPGLRNVELTGPYFHNGGQGTLEHVVQFYDRGGDFAAENLGDLAPNVARIGLQQFEEDDLVAFLKALTDDRVKYERAPFDHPSLSIPNGGTVGQRTLFGIVPLLDDRIELPAVGAGGHPIPLGSPGTPLANFPDPLWSKLSTVSGHGQQAAPGTILALPLVVQVLDAYGNPVPGVVVSFSAPPGGSVSAAQVTTGLDGKAEASATLAPDAGEQTFQAEAYAVAGSPLALVASAVPATQASDPTPSSPPATTPHATTPISKVTGGCSTGSGGGASLLLLAAAALLARRRPVFAGLRRLLVATGSVSMAVLIGCGSSGGGGSSAVDPARSTVSAAPASVVADGVAAASVTVVARDAKGAALAGKAVVFSVSGSGNTLSAAQATTGSDGGASVELASSKAEAKIVQATVGGVALEPASITFVAGAPSAERSTLAVSDPAPLFGTSVALTAAVRDAHGNPVQGATVTFSAPGVSTVVDPVASTDADGRAAGALQSNELGPKLVTATVAGSAVATASVSFVAYVGGTFCSGLTVDVHSDAANCGVCGHACAASQVCSAGTCAALSCSTLRFPPGAPAALVGLHPTSVAVADFDGDGIPDLAVANSSDGSVSVIFGSGDGIFQTPLTLHVGKTATPDPVSIAAADLNGDGFIDLVVANQGEGTVTVLLGSRTGLFGPHAELTVGSRPAFVAVGDLDGDGRPDIVVANGGDKTVGVLIQTGLNGAVAFAAQVPYTLTDPGLGTTSAAEPSSIAIADLDGDRKNDLAVATRLDSVFVLHNLGGGSFNVGPAPLQVGGAPSSIAAADLDGDGSVDLAVTNSLDGTVSVLRNIGGNATFPAAAAVTVTVGTDPVFVTAADLDGDGKLDLVVANDQDDTVSVLMNRGAAVFAARSYAAGYLPFSVVAKDLDGDGKVDLAVASFGGNAVSILGGLGGGVFAAPAKFTARPIYTVGAAPQAVVAADLDGDGKPDVAVASDGTVTVMRNRGDGVLLGPSVYAASNGPGAVMVALAAADLDGDGKLDLAVVDAAGATVSVLVNKGGGVFAAPVSYATGAKPVSVVAADLNGDGKVDLAVANQGANSVSVLLNHGDGTFAPQVSYPTGIAVPSSTAPSSITAADFDGDGKVDLAVANSGDGTASVLRNLGGGTFAPPVRVPLALGLAVRPIAIVAVDLVGDGVPDLAVADNAGHSVTILHNTRHGTTGTGAGIGPSTFVALPPQNVAVSPLFLAAADLDKDGFMDLVVASGPLASLNATDGYRAVTVLRNFGDRTGALFERAYDHLLVTPLALATADLDGNGRMDVVLLGSEGLVPLLSVCAL